MGRPATAAVYVLAMVIIVVAVDIVFFRSPVVAVDGQRGIVLVFLAVYFRFFKRS